jgi:hypothetical protein
VIQSTDGGQTWSNHSSTPLSYIKELVVNPVGREPWVCSPGGLKPGGLYKYDGDAWVSMYVYDPNQFTLVRDIIFDPDAADAQTQHIWISANLAGVVKSEDGGQSWSSIGADGEAIALNPEYPQTIYSGSPDGVSKTSDGGVSWQPINEGLTGVVPRFLGVNPLNPAIIYGSNVGAYGSQDGGETWLKVGGSGPIVVDPINPQHVVIGRSIADDGWNFDREFDIPMPPEMDGVGYQAVINSMVAQPGKWLMGVGYYDGEKPYFNYEGGGGIYLSADGETWTWVNQLLTCPPTSFGFDPVDTNIFYAATSGAYGGVSCEDTFLRSTDSGLTWHETTAGLPPGTGGFLAIESIPPYRIFLNGSYVSWDQGVTWNETNPVPVNSYLSSLLFLDGSPSFLYAGTGAGLFRSMDGAQTWQRASGVLGELEIWSLAGIASEERHILYVSTVGGAVDSSVLQTSSLVQGDEALVNAGVYRYTTLPWGYRMYLPDVMR